MSRTGNCRDNAARESFFGTLKTEPVHQRDYPDRAAARRDPSAYIEACYTRWRSHSALRHITPQQPDRKNPMTRCPLFRGKVIRRSIVSKTAG